MLLIHGCAWAGMYDVLIHGCTGMYDVLIHGCRGGGGMYDVLIHGCMCGHVVRLFSVTSCVHVRYNLSTTCQTKV